MRAFAKINLTLRVLGVRSDGYHDLRTTFQTLALHDTLTCTPARGPLRIECDEPACPTDRANLVWRAAEEIWRAAGRRGEPADLCIRIEKRIPMQAGLGGGSSDGAAALRALALLWGVRMSDDRCRALASELGADAPFFLQGGTALGIDRGDVLFPLLDWPRSWVVLLVPPFGVATAEAYKWFDSHVEHDPAGAASRSRERSAPFGELGNDLQAVVEKRNPEIGQMADALRRAGASYAAMSGSGSAVFGLFATERAAESAAGDLKNATRRTLVTRTLSRSACARLGQPVYL